MSEPAHHQDNNRFPLQCQPFCGNADGMCTCTLLVATCFSKKEEETLMRREKGSKSDGGAADEQRLAGFLSKPDNISAGEEEENTYGSETDEEGEKECFLHWTQEKRAACACSGCLMVAMKRISSLEPSLKMLVMLMKLKASSEHA